MSMRRACLIADLPDELMLKIWLPLVAADPLAVLRLETTSKHVRQRLQCVALACRCSILQQQQQGVTRACLGTVAEIINTALQKGVQLDRLEYLTLRRAVGACELSGRQKSRARKSVLRQLAHTVSAVELQRCTKLEAKCQEQISAQIMRTLDLLCKYRRFTQLCL